jgi:hypothetical protein
MAAFGTVALSTGPVPRQTRPTGRPSCAATTRVIRRMSVLSAGPVGRSFESGSMKKQSKPPTGSKPLCEAFGPEPRPPKTPSPSRLVGSRLGPEESCFSGGSDRAGCESLPRRPLHSGESPVLGHKPQPVWVRRHWLAAHEALLRASRQSQGLSRCDAALSLSSPPSPESITGLSCIPCSSRSRGTCSRSRCGSSGRRTSSIRPRPPMR